MRRIISNPHNGDPSVFVTKDLVYIGRCLGGRGQEGEGIAKLRDFYQEVYTSR